MLISGHEVIFRRACGKSFYTRRAGKIKGLIVEFVRLNGRGTIRQLSDEIGVSHTSVGRLCMELAASGDVYNSGYGVFPSEQARKDWQNARKNSQGQS